MKLIIPLAVERGVREYQVTLVNMVRRIHFIPVDVEEGEDPGFSMSLEDFRALGRMLDL